MSVHNMEKVNQVIQLESYRTCYETITQLEIERTYCKHNMHHFIDVARIAWIMNLERKLELDKEEIYLAAILHDIGRHLQYMDGIPHQESSAIIARELLEAIHCDKEQIERIIEAILRHRDRTVLGSQNLSGILYEADKASRACYACEVASRCNWSEEKKNLTIAY